jgi:DNA gyrase subunit B
VFGKICNAEREAPNRVLASPKNIDIGRALRTGFGANFNIEKLGYHKIILMSDADCFKYTKKQSSPQECGRLSAG